MFIGFRPLSGSYISQWFSMWLCKKSITVSVPYRGATFLNSYKKITAVENFHCFRPLSGSYISQLLSNVSGKSCLILFPSPIGELHFSIQAYDMSTALTQVSVPYRGATFLNLLLGLREAERNCSFRPLSGSYISQYHPRNPMSCLGRIGGLRGKSNFIEMQPFWKVKNSHKSSI